jgi:hypothetical protein
MGILNALSYCFNPFDSTYHGIDNLKNMKNRERSHVIVSTAIVSILTLGLGTIAAFRFFSHKFKVTNKNKEGPLTQAAEQAALKALGHPDKPESAETKANKAAITQYLEEKHLGTLGAAEDSGDCFYDSVAKVLTWHKEHQGSKKIITKKEVREAISNYLKNLKDPVKIQKLRELLEEEGGFEAYKQKVHLTIEDINKQQKRHEILLAEKQAKIKELTASGASESEIQRAKEELTSVSKPPATPTWEETETSKY